MPRASAEGRGIYDDFRGYRVPDDHAQDDALRTATVVVDTNVLLNLYRYNSKTRDDLLDILQGLGERLWVPHQVMREFWRNRLNVIAGRGAGTKQILDALTKNQRSLAEAIEQWARTTAVLTTERDALLDTIATAYGALREAVEARAPASVGIVGGAMREEVLVRLEVLLHGRVGAAQPAEEWEASVKEGAARVAAKVPPGYLDAEKADSGLPEGAAGDYLVWKLSMDEVRRRGGDLLIVTGDVKEDWWWRYHSEAVGPRTELVSELFEACGAQLFMMRPTDLLRRARVLDVEVADESVDDAERVDRGVLSSWTPLGVTTLLDRLDDEGREHAEVIREAAALGGRISREQIYEICEYDDGRMLRGFTRPAGGVKAVAFEVPTEFVAILGEGDGGSDPDSR